MTTQQILEAARSAKSAASVIAFVSTVIFSPREIMFLSSSFVPSAITRPLSRITMREQIISTSSM